MIFVFIILTLATVYHCQFSENRSVIRHCEKRNILYSFRKDSDTCRLPLKVHSTFDEWGLAKNQSLPQSFPMDKETRNFVRKVSDCLFSIVQPTPLKSNVKLAAVSDKVLTDILDFDVSIATSHEFVSFVGGGRLLTTPLAHRYGGHQFGYWSGQLGDGRAVMIGEYLNQRGDRYELQLKGSGKTPYSRRGDGRAVIRSSVREFLCSEALFHLGIPTSRAATLLVSDDPVVRDMFYNGNIRTERAAIVLRLAKSWFRIGSLEILANSGEIELLKNLTDFVISNYFQSIDQSDDNRYLEFFSRVVEETAHVIALWQSVGFTHGVCNTDNFSLLSITIDFGPFGFLDEYDPGFVPNTSDDEGRYSYEKQPDVGFYNLNKLREALDPLLTDQQRKHAQIILNGYADIYKRKFMDLFRRKLGLTLGNAASEEDDEQLVAILLKMMEETKSDFTMTFRQLGEIPLALLKDINAIKYYWAINTLSKHKWYHDWVSLYQNRFSFENENEKVRSTKMLKINPRYVLRNWIAQRAIEKAEKDDFSEIRHVLKILTKPFDEQSDAEISGFSDSPPDWAKKLKVSCSS